MIRLSVLAYLVIVLGGCSETIDPDISVIAAEIEQGIEGQSGIVVHLTCPDGVEWEAGEDFHCSAESEGYATTLVTVHMQSDEGEWAWETAN